jgi:sulfur relay (sulfurtransferase) complex TusBCD TusD component (DsrE family)
MIEPGGSLETLTIVINAAPYGDERAYNALRLARALVSAAVGIKVNIFLLGDAVVAAKKGQKTPDGYPNLEEMLWELVKQGVEVAACSTCASARGLAYEDIIEGVQNGTLMQLAHWLKESQGALSF